MRTASAVSTSPISLIEVGTTSFLVGQLGHDCRGQNYDIGGSAVAQFVGHDTDRAKLASDIEAGLRPEGRRRFPTNPCAAPPLKMFRVVMQSNSMAAIRLSRVIGRSRTRTPRQSNTALAIAAVTGPWAASPAPTGSSSSPLDHFDIHLGHLAETKDRIVRPIRAGDALPVEANPLLQHPARGLDGAALDLVDDAIRIDRLADIDRERQLPDADILLALDLGHCGAIGAGVLVARKADARNRRRVACRGFQFARSCRRADDVLGALVAEMAQPERDRILAALGRDLVEKGFDRKHIALRAERP